MDAGADIQAVGADGKSPLHVAVENERCQTAEVSLSILSEARTAPLLGSSSPWSRRQCRRRKWRHPFASSCRRRPSHDDQSTRPLKSLNPLLDVCRSSYLGWPSSTLSTSEERLPCTGPYPAATERSHKCVDRFWTSGQLPCDVQFLLDSGADAGIPKSNGWTALHEGSKNGYGDIVKVCLRSSSHVACRNGQRAASHRAWIRRKQMVTRSMDAVDAGIATRTP